MYVKDHLDRPGRELLHSVGPWRRRPISRVALALVAAGEVQDEAEGASLLTEGIERAGYDTRAGDVLLCERVDVDRVRVELRRIEEEYAERLVSEEFEQLQGVMAALPTAAAL